MKPWRWRLAKSSLSMMGPTTKHRACWRLCRGCGWCATRGNAVLFTRVIWAPAWPAVDTWFFLITIRSPCRDGWKRCSKCLTATPMLVWWALVSFIQTGDCRRREASSGETVQPGTMGASIIPKSHSTTTCARSITVRAPASVCRVSCSRSWAVSIWSLRLLITKTPIWQCVYARPVIGFSTSRHCGLFTSRESPRALIPPAPVSSAFNWSIGRSLPSVGARCWMSIARMASIPISKRTGELHGAF